MPNAVKVAIAGMGGFAASHHEAVWSLEQEGAADLIATCDPVLFGDDSTIRRFDLESRNVRRYRSLSDMLQQESPHVVTLPTPIPLHAGQHRAVVESHAACYLEKPPTLWWPEFQSMLAVERDAVLPTNVGFNFVGDPMRRALKARLLRGEFGKVKGASLLAIWPRDRAYYQRNDWAGKLRCQGSPVMDSPMGNAVSHFVQDLLFFCGTETVESVAHPISVQACLVSAHPIESFDTAFVSATLKEGPWLRIAVTHTGDGGQIDRETVVCEKATLVFDSWRTARIDWRNGRIEQLESQFRDYGQIFRMNLREYLRFVEGERQRPITLLSDCSSFVALHNLAFLSSGSVKRFESGRILQDEVFGRVSVHGLQEDLIGFVEQGDFPRFAHVPKAVSMAELEVMASE